MDVTSIDRRKFLIGTATAAAAAGLGAGKALAAEPNVLNITAGKVTRSGTHLLMDGQPYRMLGFNMWQAAVTTWNKPRNGSVALSFTGLLNQWLADIKASAPHVNTLRVWFFQQFALKGGQRNWTALNNVLYTAHKHGFKVIATLEDGWGYEEYGSHTPAKDTSWYTSGYKNQVLPMNKIPYRQWVQEVVTRYKGDPRIAAWELVNECNGITLPFIQDVTGLIKSIDPVTLTCCGEVGPLSSSAYALPTLDLASYHYYDQYHQTGYANCAKVAYAQGKPTIVGECGVNRSVGTSARVSQLKSLIPAMFNTNGIVGFVYWQYAEQGGDAFNMSAGDPGLKAVDSFHL